MGLKYFREGRTGQHGPEGIILEERVFSIYINKGRVYFMEECDAYFRESYTKSEAIALLEEAIAWIRAQPIEREAPPRTEEGKDE